MGQLEAQIAVFDHEWPARVSFVKSAAVGDDIGEGERLPEIDQVERGTESAEVQSLCQVAQAQPVVGENELVATAGHLEAEVQLMEPMLLRDGGVKHQASPPFASRGREWNWLIGLRSGRWSSRCRPGETWFCAFFEFEEELPAFRDVWGINERTDEIVTEELVFVTPQALDGLRFAGDSAEALLELEKSVGDHFIRNRLAVIKPSGQ
jgi:hypothetical protein